MHWELAVEVDFRFEEHSSSASVLMPFYIRFITKFIQLCFKEVVQYYIHEVIKDTCLNYDR